LNILYNKINIFLPTRKRVKNGILLRHLKYAEKYVSDPGRILYTFLVDQDDVETLAFLSKKENIPFEYCVVINAEVGAPNLAGFYNRMYRETEFNSDEIIVSMVGDDMVWKSHGYDVRILDEINRKNGRALVYCNDDYYQGENLCVNLFTTRSVVEATGKDFMCPLFPVDHIDNIWMEFGRKTGLLVYLGEVILKHEHNRRKWRIFRDQTYERLRQTVGESEVNLSLIEDYIDELVLHYNDFWTNMKDAEC